jgi:hypothetical protein|tara:strand:+ start:300 stop:608 length:309 start_codon:yes stop_codon:yes gene_type:complete
MLESKPIELSILDYMGKFEGGIMTLIDVKHDSKHYSGTFFYTEDTIALTVDNSLEEELGCTIEDHKSYKELVFDILNKVVPHKEIINSIDDIDLTDYIKKEE